MANELNEKEALVNNSGRDINVIEKQIPVKTGKGSIVFEVILWILGIIPGLIFLLIKIKAQDYLKGLEQRIQHNASQIDNYLEQRVIILQNVVPLVEKSVKLDKEVMQNVAESRSGLTSGNDQTRNNLQNNLDNALRSVRVAFEAYPNLKAHATIADAIQQNSYLQREITAAREVYNDSVLRWNQEIQIWPAKRIVAAKNGYTTRIPFSASQETKNQAREVFFKE